MCAAIDDVYMHFTDRATRVACVTKLATNIDQQVPAVRRCAMFRYFVADRQARQYGFIWRNGHRLARLLECRTVSPVSLGKFYTTTIKRENPIPNYNLRFITQTLK